MTWKELLSQEKTSANFKSVLEFLKKEKSAGKKIFPAEKNIFQAFSLTPFDDLKVVILGQDPYHGEGQAHGLCFSVQKNTPVPPSLQNIYKELATDLNLKIPKKENQSGDLSKWAKQGVFLLNSILTVQANSPASHGKIGWQEFTDKVIQEISDHKNHVVFLLWGNFAKSKLPLIDTKKHTVFTAAHPSPFSAYNGFFGCRHFSKTNADLKKHGLAPIDWEID